MNIERSIIKSKDFRESRPKRRDFHNSHYNALYNKTYDDHTTMHFRVSKHPQGNIDTQALKGTLSQREYHPHSSHLKWISREIFSKPRVFQISKNKSFISSKEVKGLAISIDNSLQSFLILIPSSNQQFTRLSSLSLIIDMAMCIHSDEKLIFSNRSSLFRDFLDSLLDIIHQLVLTQQNEKQLRSISMIFVFKNSIFHFVACQTACQWKI